MNQDITERILVEVLDMKKEIKQVKEELKKEIQEVDTKLTKQIQEVDTKFTKQIQDVTKQMQEMNTQLTKEIQKNRKLLEDNMKDQGEINLAIMKDVATEKTERIAQVTRLERLMKKAQLA